MLASSKPRADHWLYRLIPVERSAITAWWQWPLWALCGNDDDGLFGEPYINGWYKDKTPSFWLAVQWWARNPFYNLCTRVINWPRKRVLVIYAWATGHGARWFFMHPQFRWFVENGRPRQIAFVLWPVYFVYQGRRIEAYFGWGSDDGRFGFALRQARSPDADEL